MDIEYHIVFSQNRLEERPLWDYLVKNNIPHNATPGYNIGTVDILSSHPNWPEISEFLKRTHFLVLTDMVFSKEELLAAPWIRIRTTSRYGYPQPDDNFEYKRITYERNGKCGTCKAGLSQADAFRLKKIPSWKRRHVFAPFWVEDELFVSDVFADAFKNAGVTGVEFREVKKNNGLDVYPGVHQMFVTNHLKEGFLENDASIRETTVCMECGRKTYFQYAHVQESFHKEIFEGAPDVVKTAERFGQDPVNGVPLMLINQKVYRLLVEKKLDKALKFYPINLV